MSLMSLGVIAIFHLSLMPPLTVRELVVAVVERASTAQEANSNLDEEWLPFHQILAHFNAVCAEKNVDSTLQQRVYQVLLMMSSETERELTWWQRVAQLDRYTRSSSNGGPAARRAAQRARTQRPGPPQQLVM